MSYGIKYNVLYKDILNRSTEIQLFKDGYSGSATEIRGTTNPLTFSFDSEKFQPVFGTTASINVFSTTDRQLLDLYTANPKEWMVKVLKSGSLFYLGYLETEMYNEVFDEYYNYEVNVVANDGLGILDRISYLDGSGNNYTGHNSIWSIIERIIQKMGLPYTVLNTVFSFDTSSISYGVNENILQYIAVNNDNYYDEDNEPLSCRKVLESILEPLTLTMFSDAGELWIIDREYISGTSPNPTVMKWTISSGLTLSYSGSTSYPSWLQYSGLTSISSKFEIESGYNFHKIKRNRYLKPLFEETNFNKDFSPSTYSYLLTLDNYDSNVEDVGYNYLRALDSFDNWRMITSGVTGGFFGGMKPRKYENGTDVPSGDTSGYDNFIVVYNPNYSATLQNDYNIAENYTQVFSYTGSTPYFAPSNLTSLKFSFKTKIISQGYKDDDGNWNDCSVAQGKFGYFIYYTTIRLVDANGNTIAFLRMDGDSGGTWDETTSVVKSPTYSWVTYSSHTEAQMITRLVISNFTDDSKTAINPILNEFTDVSLIIPLDIPYAGKVTVTFYNQFHQYWFKGNSYLESPDDYYQMTIFGFGFKDFKTSLVDAETFEDMPDKDEEILFTVSNTNQYRTDSRTTEFIHYGHDNVFANDVAGFLVSTHTSLTGLTVPTDYSINSQTEDDFIELIGNKYVRNYQTPRIVLNSEIMGTASDFGFVTNLSKLSTIKMGNDTYWNTKKWIIRAWEYNDYDCIINLTADEML